MNDKKKLLLCILLLVFDVFITFVFAGVPRDSISHYVYHAGKHIPAIHSNQVFYRVLSDVTLKDINGEEVHYYEGSRISYHTVMAEIDRAMDPETYGRDGVKIESHIFSESVFKDASVFENITEQVYAEEKERIRLEKAEDAKLYIKKTVDDLFWYVSPAQGPVQYKTSLISGLAFAAAALTADLLVFFVFPKKRRAFYISSIVIKTLVFVLFFLMVKR